MLSGGLGGDTFVFSQATSGITTTSADVVTDWNAAEDTINMWLSGTTLNAVGTSENYREASTTVTSVEAAAAYAESKFTNTNISHVFLYNVSTDTGYILSDIHNDDIFETAAVLKGAGSASDFHYTSLL